MGLEVAGDVAMILPLPVSPGSAEDAVRFLDLSGYPELFRHLSAGFPMAASLGSPPRRGPAMGAVPRLEVHQVGDFEASFVPAQKDFARLDERFRLPPDTWKKLPAYADWGFAVFKLRTSSKVGRFFGRKEKRDYHPMAFDFPRRDPSRLFFPTVHIHDGDVHATARFDHTLFLQAAGDRAIVDGWDASYAQATFFASADRAKGILDGAGLVFRKLLVGEMANEDVVVDVT
jgi:hypothetical protein